ncbi:MAG: cyclase family protein [Actinomycetota bacterium]
MRKPDPPLFGRSPFGHEVTGDERAVSHDDVLHGWNTQSSSQWDGFRHIRNFAAQHDEDGTGHFGGINDDEHGMHHWAQRGIAGRAVLCDVARWREAVGRPIQHDKSDPIEADELLECLAHQGTELEEGDILLVRTGWIGWYERQPREVRERMAVVSELRTPGLRSDERTAEVLWDMHIAAIAADNPAVEVWPPGALRTAEENAEVRADRRRMHEIFTHTLFLPMLGLPLGEMFVLDHLADDCADDGRYTGFFTSAQSSARGSSTNISPSGKPSIGRKSVWVKISCMRRRSARTSAFSSEVRNAPGGHTSTAGLSAAMAAMCMSHNTSAVRSSERKPGVRSSLTTAMRSRTSRG